MKNAGQERGIWSALCYWGLFALRGLPLLGAAIAFVALLALFFITLAGFHFGYADKLADFFGHEKTDGLSAGGHFARNLGFALLALGGIAMAAWRNREMSRQADAALNQSRASEKQADAVGVQIKNESNRIAGERFSDGIKMLAQNNEKSNPAIAARIGGIYALQSLANNYISQYAVQVVKTLVAYVRVNVQLTKIPHKDSIINFLGEDVKTAFAVLTQLLDRRDEFELSDNDLDFSECDFSGLYLDHRQVSSLRHYRWLGADLQGSDLRGSDLRESDLRKSDLRGSDLRCADFRGARMYGAKLRGATLCGANLEGAYLYNADLRGANLRVEREHEKNGRTNLRDADLRGADLRGAAFPNADLSCANVSAVKLQDTDLREAILSDAGILPGLPDQIWHSDDQPGLEGVKSIEISSDRVWDLEPYRNCPYALTGVLHNYRIIYGRDFNIVFSRGLLKAARKLLDDNQLPKEFPENWRKWLEEVDPKTGIHLDWEKQNSLPHN